MGKVLILLTLCSAVFCGEGTLIVTNRTGERVSVQWEVRNDLGKMRSGKNDVPKGAFDRPSGMVVWPSIENLFPREMLRGVNVLIDIYVYDEKGLLMATERRSHAFKRKPYDYEHKEIRADLWVQIDSDFTTRLWVR